VLCELFSQRILPDAAVRHTPVLCAYGQRDHLLHRIGFTEWSEYEAQIQSICRQVRFTPLISDHFRSNLDLSSCVAVATDAGGAKRTGRFAEGLRIPMAIIDKRRIDDGHVKQGLVVGDVQGLNAIIFEDEISTGGTLAATAETLTKAGVEKIYVGATHAVLCGPAMERLKKMPVAEVVVTNTVHLPKEKKIAKLTALSVAPLLAEAIQRINNGESIGALFESQTE
jgi:ribose-phosphate pyrophosphokinase